MPHYCQSIDPPSRSRKIWNSSIDRPPQGDHFTESKHSSGGQTACENGQASLNRKSTEPFPSDLFRLPVPNRVFGEMSGLSDAALRCLLALIHLFWRFDPKEKSWIHTEEWLMRADVQDECGLSDQGARDGLSALEAQGWVEIDRSGRSYQYRLLLEVPTRRFTYLPTSLFERASATGSATALRVLLAVFRKTWGWTETREDPETGDLQTVHQRWAQLSEADLARITGHSDTAISQVMKALEGTWLGRSRPDARAHFYRILPRAFGPEGEEEEIKGEAPPNTSTANIVTPRRQRSCPSSFNKESSSKDKHAQTGKKAETHRELSQSCSEDDAMPSGKQTQPERHTQNHNPEEDNEQSPDLNFTGLPDGKETLAEKLSNVGVWAGRIAEILSRFSRRRIEVNFELYRRRAAEQTIRNPGAWLYQAITNGYAIPSSDLSSDSEPSDSPSTGTSLPPLEHEQILSEAKKEAYVAQGIDEDRFKQCPPGPNGQRFMYFDPNGEGPNHRRPSRENTLSAM